jgi:uncharacterized protein (DUF1697 family)
MLEEMRCSNVQTYVQSGNAVFETRLGTVELTKAIEAALERHMGRPIPTTVRTHAQLRAIVDANPFTDVATNPACLCVTFLSRAPQETEVAPLRSQDFAPELFRISGREIYSWHPNGQARSPLTASIGKLRLPGAVTTRNWNTVRKLLTLLAEV